MAEKAEKRVRSKTQNQEHLKWEGEFKGWATL